MNGETNNTVSTDNTNVVNEMPAQNQEVTPTEMPALNNAAPVATEAAPVTTETATPEVVATPNNQAAETPVAQTETTTEPVTEAPKNSKNTEPPTENIMPHNPKVNDQVLVEVKPEKDGNLLGIILFFGVIVAFLFFLPTINSFLGTIFPSLVQGDPIYIKPTPSDENNNTENNNNPDTKEEKKLYDIDSLVSAATIDDIKLGNFVKDQKDGMNVMKFYLLNDGETPFSFDDKTKFFIDFYENDKYISSVIIFMYETLAPKESKDYEVLISKQVYEKANKFALTRKKTSEYPSITLKKTDGDYKILTCTYGYDTLDYYFIDNYLERIEETYKVENTNPAYITLLQEQQNLSNKYNVINAIEHDVIESNTNFVAKTTFELKDIDDATLNKLSTYKFFSYHKESKVVSYELGSLGYNCS